MARTTKKQVPVTLLNSAEEETSTLLEAMALLEIEEGREVDLECEELVVIVSKCEIESDTGVGSLVDDGVDPEMVAVELEAVEIVAVVLLLIVWIK